MKASHRKDVIIARLIFAAICLFLIALIVTIVITVNSKGGKKKEQDKVQQNAVSESETDSVGDSDTEIGAIYLPQQTTEGTEKTYVTTTSSVNMREKPDKNANIVTVIAQDVKLEFVSEDNGWTQVIFQGQTGYVSSDYVKSDMADSTTDSGTSGAADSGAASQGTADGSTTGADIQSENTIYMGLLQNTDISCHYRNHSSHNLYLRPACAEKYCFERIMRKCRKQHHRGQRRRYFQ